MPSKRFSTLSASSTSSTSSVRSIADSIASQASRFSTRFRDATSFGKKSSLKITTEGLPSTSEENVPDILSPSAYMDAEYLEDDNMGWGAPSKSKSRRNPF